MNPYFEASMLFVSMERIRKFGRELKPGLSSREGITPTSHPFGFILLSFSICFSVILYAPSFQAFRALSNQPPEGISFLTNSFKVTMKAAMKNASKEIIETRISKTLFPLTISP